MPRRKKATPPVITSSTDADLEVIATYMRELPCAISDEERDSYAMRAAAVQHEVEEISEQLRTEGKTLRDRRKMRELERNELLAWVRTGEVLRPIQVEERACYRTNRVVTVRTDTGVQVDERAMTAEERQEELPLGGGNGTTHEAHEAHEAEDLV